MNDLMQRRMFLLSAGGIGGATLIAGNAVGQEARKTDAKVVTATDAKMVWVLGARVTIRADAKLTGGAYSVFEDLLLPGQGPPLHTHTNEDETMYVIEGELEVVLGDQTYLVKPGDFAHMARGVPHRFKNVSDKPTRMLLSYSPGGFEQWFLDVGTPVVDPLEMPPVVTAADIQKAVKAAEGFGVIFAKKPPAK